MCALSAPSVRPRELPAELAYSTGTVKNDVQSIIKKLSVSDRTQGEWRPDVVHAHLIHTHLGYHALTQARRAGAGVVFTAHDVMTFCYQKLTCFHGGSYRGGAAR